MKKIANTIRSRRGVAIEMAILAMLVMIALGIILLTTSVEESKHTKDVRDDLVAEVAINQAAQAAILGETPDGYDVAREIDSDDATRTVMTVKKDGYELVVKFVTDTKEIKSWDLK